MSGQVRPKRIYFALRHPQWFGDAFKARWRQHGQLAMRFMSEQSWAHVDRYVHGDRIALDGFPSTGRAYDGMGIVFFNSPWSRQQHLANEQAREVLLADEDETFVDRVSQHGMVCQENIVLRLQNSSVKWVQIYKANPGCSLEVMDQHLGVHRELLLSQPNLGIQSWIENRPLPPESMAGWGLSADVIVEIGFQSVDAVQDLVNRNAIKHIEPIQSSLISCTLSMLVKDIDLKGAAHA